MCFEINEELNMLLRNLNRYNLKGEKNKSAFHILHISPNPASLWLSCCKPCFVISSRHGFPCPWPGSQEASKFGGPNWGSISVYQYLYLMKGAGFFPVFPFHRHFACTKVNVISQRKRTKIYFCSSLHYFVLVIFSAILYSIDAFFT